MIQGIQSPIVFAMPTYYFWGVQQTGNYSKKEFACGEIELTLHNDVYGRDVTILASAGQAQEFLELCVLIHTIKKAGAQSIQLLMPYLWYARLDKTDNLHSFGLEWFLSQLFSLGISGIKTFDAHNREYIQYFVQQKISGSVAAPRIQNISHESFWGDLVLQYGQQGYGLVFPDQGAYKRYKVYESMGPLAWFEKQRQGETIELLSMHGVVEKKVLLLDDILFSGQTLLRACVALREAGVQEIEVCVSHGFFVGQAWRDLFSLGVQLLHVSDSLSYAKELAHPLVKIYNLKNLFIK